MRQYWQIWKNEHDDENALKTEREAKRRALEEEKSAKIQRMRNKIEGNFSSRKDLF